MFFTCASTDDRSSPRWRRQADPVVLSGRQTVRGAHQLLAQLTPLPGPIHRPPPVRGPYRVVARALCSPLSRGAASCVRDAASTPPRPFRRHRCPRLRDRCLLLGPHASLVLPEKGVEASGRLPPLVCLLGARLAHCIVCLWFSARDTKVSAFIPSCPDVECRIRIQVSVAGPDVPPSNSDMAILCPLVATIAASKITNERQGLGTPSGRFPAPIS